MTLPFCASLGDGPTVLMLHGIGGGHAAFAPQLVGLAAAGMRAVAWDAPGYGRSATMMPYTFDGLAGSAIDLIESIIRTTGETSVALLGHSMGGMVAQDVAARRPDLVRALVLAGTSASFGKTDGIWQAAFIAERAAPLDVGLGMAGLAKTLVPAMLGPLAHADACSQATRVMAVVPEATYRLALQALMGFDRRSSLARLAMPVLLIAGEMDRNSPVAVMRRMADSVAGSRLEVMSGIGHLMPLEAPEDFNRLLIEFLQSGQ